MNVTIKNIPDNVYVQLKGFAEEQERSLNAQIIYLDRSQLWSEVKFASAATLAAAAPESIDFIATGTPCAR